MASLFKKHPVAVILSVLFHVLLISLFVFGVDFFDEPVESKPPVNIVKATVIDDSKVQAAAEKFKKLEQKKKLDEKKRLQKLKNERLTEEKKLADLKKEQLDQQHKIENQKVAEAARLAKLKKQKKAEAKKKAAADKRKKAEQTKKKALAKKKKAEDAKRKKAADAKKRAQQEQADAINAMRQAAHEEEQERLAQKAIASFSDVIRQKVERNWIQPAGDISGLSCIVRVKLIPGGDVADVQVIKSSGNGLFDRSVELATRKASPLPIPSDPTLFNQFRNLEFYFKPGE
ncbi:MAG: protein TolA [Piscirickettsiaceae bacterium]|nr:MAG: protein TolA [Piscirickettsiaceae bacterium]PCI70625.1 MAG: protein TolA [Piscirickettsiaceae bacterium]